MSLHFYMSKNVRNKKIDWFPELDDNFPKEILPPTFPPPKKKRAFLELMSSVGLKEKISKGKYQSHISIQTMDIQN